MPGVRTAMCPFVQKPSASPSAAPTTFNNLLLFIQSTSCQVAKTTQAVKIASMRTSLFARMYAKAEATMSADNLPTSALYKLFPKRYVEYVPSRVNKNDGNLYAKPVTPNKE